jgi:hypothetical protein
MSSLDPRDGDPLWVPEPALSRFREQPRQRRLGCSVWTLAAFVACLAFWAAAYLVVVAVAAPRSAPEMAPEATVPVPFGLGDTQGRTGAPYQVGGEAAWQVERGTRPVPEEQQYGAPLPVATTVNPRLTSQDLAAVTWTGKLGYALPSHGSRYLAIRWPRGTVATLCGPADCVTRTSTDFGPVRSLWEAGRLADLSAVDWQRVCGAPLRFGLCSGTLLIVSRPRALPETDEEGQ